MERLEAAMQKARAARRAMREKEGLPGSDAPDWMPPPAAPASGQTVSGQTAPPPAPDTQSPLVLTPDDLATSPADLAADLTADWPADWTALRRIDLAPNLAAKRRLGALMGPQEAAPYDLLRTRVLRQMTEQKWTRLAITSPNKGCGKSTVSLNLALSLARQPDLRILLMDLDLRRPALARMLNQPRVESLALLLEGGVDFADHAVRFGPNLALCLNHHGIRNSSELLQSARTGEVLDAIEARWKPDIILFDMPPMQGNDDSLGFLGRVDAALLVAAAGSTALSQVDKCEKELASLTNVMGVVLNKCRYLGTEPGYDAYY